METGRKRFVTFLCSRNPFAQNETSQAPQIRSVVRTVAAGLEPPGALEAPYIFFKRTDEIHAFLS
eukprot:COSAG04_NODE_19910_length_405_cov_1.019608_2_plen_65_part_00